ncbi:S41 family peptidase [Chitinophaga sp. Hz27]|uniref:S41 family peptidase n=1 Tax=Chitinophaga sp. Hz27 TaxID=3347169 RepID=UPI0035DAE456
MHKRIRTLAVRLMLVSSVITLTYSCKKDLKTDPSGNGGNGGNGGGTTALSAEDSLKYLMYNIMQVSYGDGGRNKTAGLPTYFWYTSVPSLNPLDAKYSTADALLTAMKGYAINPDTKNPYDRYSFLDRTGVLTNKLINGVSATTYVSASNGDIGMEYTPVLDANNNLRIFVLYADKNSPAGQAGVTRGWEITSINGNSTFQNTTAFLQQAYNSILNSASVTLGFKLPDGSTKTITLNQATYNVNPVAFDSVLNIGTNKVGYFVLYTFSSVINSSGQATFTKTAIDNAFSKFKAAGINNLVVDLRYNGGGAVTTAEYLDSLIAPSTAAGKVMYNYKYNDVMQANAAQIGLETVVNFPTTLGGFNLSNVFFITSRNTASASELTLNNLRPYMNVHLVGDTTYGKPVGFIDFNISMYDSTHTKKYLADLYAINFATTNANNSGGYYSGIAPDPNAQATDYVNVPWGDIVNDANLKAVAKFLNAGTFRSAVSARAESLGAAGLEPLKGSSSIQNNFNGMVDYKLSKKIQQLMK